MTAYYIWKSFNKWVSPHIVFEALPRDEGSFFLESGMPYAYDGRYSFMGFRPALTLKTDSLRLIDELGRILSVYKIPPLPIAPFLGGAVGYFSYDLGFRLEKIRQGEALDDLCLPECVLYFYNCALIFDHVKRRVIVFSCGFPEKKSALQKRRADDGLKRICELLNASTCAHRRVDDDRAAGLESNLTKDEYCRRIKRSKYYISEGDIYQVNFSQRFRVNSTAPAADIYQRLRRFSPSNFSAYLDCGTFQIASSSPERFLKVDQDSVRTQPMKGTRPRGSNRSEDISLRRQLLISPKDKAELLMIVDLERNDLGRVCEYNTIKVDDLRRLERYKTVFQTTAVVSGRLKHGAGIGDLIKAVFPGGSITGCPKIRSMEIIDELEPHKRGIYTGSLGYFSFSGNADLNILIRTILKKGDHLYFHTGGGIVADSDPLKEYDETLVKARAMMQAAGVAQ